MRVSSISFGNTVKLQGPGQYESRDYTFHATADVAEGEDPLAASQDLAAYVKSVMAEQVKPFMDYRTELRRNKLQEVYEGLPRELRHLVDPSMFGEEKGNGK